MQFDQLKRREFIALLGGSAVACPFSACAQQPAMPVIGFLHAGSADGFAEPLRAFRQGLSETGYVEGRNVAIEYRWADGRNKTLPDLATDLVRRRMNVIVATGGERAARIVRAIMAFPPTIPIVFMAGGDSVQAGLVAKQLEMLHEVVPTVSKIAVLLNPTNSNVESPSSELQAAARAFGVQFQVVRASTERDLDPVFATLGQLQVGALMITPDPFFLDRGGRLGALTLRHAIPAIHSYREFAAAGGLMSYGGSLTDAGRIMGVYAGRILNGEKPGDLPPTRLEFVINLQTAKALGLTLLPTLLALADEVIE